MNTTEPLVPIEDVAKHFAVSVSTIRAWLRQGLIPQDSYIKVGSTYRFSIPKMVEGLVAQQKDDVQPAPVPIISVHETESTPVQLELDFNNPDEDA
jgi:hypothetical protein